MEQQRADLHRQVAVTVPAEPPVARRDDCSTGSRCLFVTVTVVFPPHQEPGHLTNPLIDPMLAAATAPARELAERYRALERFAGEMAAALEDAAAESGPLPPGPEPVAARPPLARVETPSGEVNALLDFQEQLASLEGVVKVTVAGASRDRTTFLVELEPEAGAGPPHREECARCGRILSHGVEPASHGLCEDCRREFGR